MRTCPHCGKPTTLPRVKKDLPEKAVRDAVLGYARDAILFRRDDGYAIDWPSGDRFLASGAPSRRAAWRRALKMVRQSSPKLDVSRQVQ